MIVLIISTIISPTIIPINLRLYLFLILPLLVIFLGYPFIIHAWLIVHYHHHYHPHDFIGISRRLVKHVDVCSSSSSSSPRSYHHHQAFFIPKRFHSNCVYEQHGSSPLFQIPSHRLISEIPTVITAATEVDENSLSINQMYSSSLSNHQRLIHLGIDELYPPHSLELRNSISRSDGYWSFKKQGQNATINNNIDQNQSIQFTYGEYDFDFFTHLLHRAYIHYYHHNNNSMNHTDEINNNSKNITFVDLGSGSGRLVFTAAALYPTWTKCRGIEILPGLHQLAMKIWKHTTLLSEESRWGRYSKPLDDGIEEEEESSSSYLDIDVDRQEWKKMKQQSKSHMDPPEEEEDSIPTMDVSHLQHILQNMTLEEWDTILLDYDFSHDTSSSLSLNPNEDEDSNSISKDIVMNISLGYHDDSTGYNQYGTTSPDLDSITYKKEEEDDDHDEDRSHDIQYAMKDKSHLQDDYFVSNRNKNTTTSSSSSSSPSFWNILDQIEEDFQPYTFHDDFETNGMMNQQSQQTSSYIYFSSWEDLDSLSIDTWNEKFIHEEEFYRDLNLWNYTQQDTTRMNNMSCLSTVDSSHIHSGESLFLSDNVNTSKQYLPCPTPIHDNYSNPFTTTTTNITTENNTTLVYLPLAPIQFSCASFTDPYEYLADVDIAFCFSSCMTHDGMTHLAQALGRQSKPGSIIITTEFPLPLEGYIPPLEDDPSMPFGSYKIDLVEVLEGNCCVVGGTSTAYIHRMTQSFGNEYGIQKRIPPVIPLHEQAFRLIQAVENGMLTNTTTFIRNVRNALVFYGFLDEFHAMDHINMTCDKNNNITDIDT